MSRPTLNPSTSLFLDLARILAALMVVLHHVFEPPFHEGSLSFPGRQSVIVFFVISGFVIAYATTTQSDWRGYAVARLARIYSVAVPAMALCAVLVALQSSWLAPPQAAVDHPVLRVVVSLLFANQFWNLTVAALTDGPYWSLCYEVWYYVLFGVLVFARGWRRVAGVAGVVLLVGPRILLLMPIWWTGVLAYRVTARVSLSQAAWSRPAFWALVIVLIGAMTLGLPLGAVNDAVQASLVDGYLPLGSARLFVGGDARFISDWVLGLLFAACVCLSARPAADHRAAGTWARWVQLCSSYTFSLYLFHVPVLVFAHAALAPLLPLAVVPWVMLAVIVLSVLVLGRYTEHRKGPWVRLFGILLKRQARTSA